jgi:carboxyl-terminal processing protease
MDSQENGLENHAPEPCQVRRKTRVFALALLGGTLLGWIAAVGCASTQKPDDLKLVSQAYDRIQRNYVDRSAVQPKDLTYGAISGMVESLGDTGHSTFLTPEMVKELRSLERGELKGIGVEVEMKNGQVVIVAPIDGSPAQRAGLRPGEVILKVSGEDIADWPLGKVVERILGPAGTIVQLTLQEPRNGRIHEVTLKRASIKLHEVTWCRLPGTDVAQLRVASFDAGVTKDLRKSLEELQREGLKGIVLDMRNDPGGLLDEAIGVASQFLTNGNVVLTRDAKGRVFPEPVDKGGLAGSMPLVVLVNQGSASAAEIVAGALQDQKRAPLVGDTTFGTGTVLQEFSLSDGSALLLAVGEWLTPNGTSFWHKGLVPQYVVPLPTDTSPLIPANAASLTPKELWASEDRQLLTALRLLTRNDPPSQLGRIDGASK